LDETENKTAESASPVSAQAHSEVVAPTPAQPIVAGPGQYYRNTRYIMSALTIVMGFWFGYDGFVRWPAEHQKIVELTAQVNAQPDNADLRTELKGHTDHSPTDIMLQRVLAFSLPPLGICLLLWALYNSRGQYRLADETVFIPGHPPVPLPAIRQLDESTWDRKGIARFSYELSDAGAGTAKLDDFVYDRAPTDLIFGRIKAHLQPPAEESPADEPVAAPASDTPLPPIV
jgi:hypothetical protein